MKRFVLNTFFLLGILQGTIWSQANNSLVDQAWSALTKGENQKAEALFLKAIKQNPQNTRGYLGLALYYKNREKYEEALDVFNQSLKYLENPAPYLFAWEKLPKFSTLLEKKEPAKCKAFYQKVIQHTDPLKILEAFGYENLGNLYLNFGEYKKADQALKHLASITQWNLIGPFDNVSASGFNQTYAPEKEYDPNATYIGLNGAMVHWFPVKQVSRRKWVFLENYFPFKEGIYYALNFIYSPEKQTVLIRVGTSGSLKVFLNDELMLSIPQERNNGLDTYVVRTELQSGWNKILLKLGHYDIENCNFLFRLSDAQGNVFNPEKISLEPQSYLEKPQAPVQYVPNFAEEYFKQQIKRFPNYPENYLFLAETYSKNDKSTLAEQTLLQGLERFPKNSAFLLNLFEAYIRGQKWNEATTILNTLSKVDDTVPAALQYNIATALKSDDFTTAEQNLKKLEKVAPESKQFYDLTIQYYSKKKQIEKIIQYIDQAWQKYPYDWTFNLYKIIILQQVEKDINKAIKVNENYVKKYKEEEALVNLLNLYFQRRDGDDWKDGFEEIFKLLPDKPEYYYQLGAIYAGFQDFKKARRYIQKALELSPINPDFWNGLGDVERMAGRKEQAIKAYQKALDCFPKFYEVYPKIRELQNKPSYFSYFRSLDIDSLRQNAPSAADYPDDSMIGLLDYRRRVVYKRGATETLAEYMVKALNNDGVDYLKEYYFSTNPNFQNAVIEKAVVFKADGREVNADVNDDQVVFKSLEPGDCIYLRWKTKDYYFGQLTPHFWDSFDFDEYYPAYNKIYALYIEGDKPFTYAVKNMDLKPTVKELPEGKIYEWRVDFMKKIQHEKGMPSYEQIGRIFYLSSIPNWQFVAHWYQGLTGNKVKPTYEIENLVKQLLKGKEGLSLKDKVRIIYDFVTEKIRYSSVSFRQSGLIPQKASDVLSTRLGDCKDKATLFISMLQTIGVNAHYVLVNTDRRKWPFEYPPSIDFDHAIATLTIDSTRYFLDLTAYNYPMGILPWDDKDAFALIIASDSQKPFYLPQEDVIPNSIQRQREVEIMPDFSMKVHVKTDRQGRWAATFRSRYRDEGEQERMKILLNSIASEFQNVNLESFTIQNLDTLTPDIHYQYQYTANSFVTKTGNLRIFKVHWIDAKEQDERMALDKRKYPLSLGRDLGNYYEKVSIHFSETLIPVELPKPVKISSPFGEYHVSYSFNNGVFEAERRFYYKTLLISPEDYKAFKTFYTKVVENDNRQLVFKLKN